MQWIGVVCPESSRKLIGGRYMNSTTERRLGAIKRTRRCPICQGDGCGVGDVAVLCWRVQSSKQAANNAFIHYFDNAQPRPLYARPVEKPLSLPCDPGKLDKIYSALISRLQLSDSHRKYLQTERRLTDETIESAGFRTVPSAKQAAELAVRLDEGFGVDCVPGFFLDQGRPRMVYGGRDAIIYPLRGLNGRVVGLQVRFLSGEARYKMFSSSQLDRGGNSGNPAHYIRPDSADGEVVITEGPLKATIVSQFLPGKCVIGLVAAWASDSLGAVVAAGIEANMVSLAFDQDLFDNPTVFRGLATVRRSLLAAGLAVRVCTWDRNYKGIDDLLIAKGADQWNSYQH